MVSETPEEALTEWDIACLNPCFNGIWSLRWKTLTEPIEFYMS